MIRNLSPKEFVDSFTQKNFYSNTLKYLYNADSQNGLYICKAPDNSGTNTFIYLLTLYRIANLTICPCRSGITNHAIIWHSWQPNLVFKALKELMENSSLFIETKTIEELKSNSDLDKLHIYYYPCGNGFRFDGVELTIASRMKMDTLGKEDEGVTTPLYKVMGIIYELYEGAAPMAEKEDPFYEDFGKLVKEGAYKHPDYRLDKWSNAYTPFCIINSSKVFKCEPVEFNNIDTIEFTAAPFNSMLEKQCNGLAASSVLCDYLKKTKQEMYNSLSDSILLPPEFGPLKGDDVEDILREVLGLYKGWDYGPNLKVEKPKKEEKEPEITSFIKKGRKYAQLIANQSKYMIHYFTNKTALEKRDTFEKLSKTLNVKLESEADVLEHIVNIFSLEEFEDSSVPCTITGMCKNWRVLRDFRSINMGEDPTNPGQIIERSVEVIDKLYCDKETLFKEMNTQEHFSDELIIGIPLDFETGCIRGVWRKNKLNEYYSNIEA